MTVDYLRREVKKGRGMLCEVKGKEVNVTGETKLNELQELYGKELTVEDILSAAWYLK